MIIYLFNLLSLYMRGETSQETDKLLIYCLFFATGSILCGYINGVGLLIFVREMCESELGKRGGERPLSLRGDIQVWNMCVESEDRCGGVE